VHPTQIELGSRPVRLNRKIYAPFPTPWCNTLAAGRLLVGATAADDLRTEKFFWNAANSAGNAAASYELAPIAASGGDPERHAAG